MSGKYIDNSYLTVLISVLKDYVVHIFRYITLVYFSGNKKLYAHCKIPKQYRIYKVEGYFSIVPLPRDNPRFSLMYTLLDF